MDIILTLSVSLAIALVLGYVTQRLGLSPIVGYLVAGVIVSPNTPGFVANHEITEQLSEMGIVLLMFGVGIRFDIKELLAVRKFALPGAAVQSAAATGLGAVAAVLLGGATGWVGGIVFGLALSVASTVVMTRVLADHDDLHSPAGHIAVGWTIVEDILTVLILVLLPAIYTPAAPGTGSVLLTAGVAVLKIALLMVITFLVGGRVVPWLLKKVAATRSRELFTLTVLVVALGIAFGSSKIFGVSMALGAFLGGMVVGRSDFSLRAASEALPMRDAFAVLFFVAVGMLFEPRAILDAPWLAVATLGIVLLGKPLVTFLLVRILGQTRRTALSVGLALGQIGEFSFILASVATTLGLFSPIATSILVAVAIISIALNPLTRRLIGPLGSLGRRTGTPKARVADPGTPAEASKAVDDARRRAVVIGYGPVGRTLHRILTEEGVTCTIIEMNLETVQRLRAQGIAAVYGDAGHHDTLVSAGVAGSANLILSASGLPAPQEIIRMAREINPAIRVIVRSGYLRERPALRAAGADLVFSGEGEVALAMNETILRDLGANPERILAERDRLRAELFGG